MAYAFRWIITFIILSVLLTLASVFILDIDLLLNGLILYSSFISLLVTIIWGSIETVFIRKRQIEIENLYFLACLSAACVYYKNVSSWQGADFIEFIPKVWLTD